MNPPPRKARSRCCLINHAEMGVTWDMGVEECHGERYLYVYMIYMMSVFMNNYATETKEFEVTYHKTEFP